MKVSLVMSSFDRSRQLAFTLPSIIRQEVIWDIEVVVVNDGMSNDGTREICERYSNVKYVFSGKRNVDSLQVRNPCIPNNIAIRQASGDIVILTCPEIYHIGDMIRSIVEPILRDERIVTVPNQMYWDVDAAVLNSMPNDSPPLEKCKSFGQEKTRFPYMLGVNKKHLITLGGYDEDFAGGFASEDDDLIRRFRQAGLRHSFVGATAIHLWHPSVRNHPEWDKKRALNRKVLAARKGIRRNINREWGQL